jgi:simple sugar transport system permease protein
MGEGQQSAFSRSTLRSIYKAAISIILTLVVISILFIATGFNPLSAYYYMFYGAFGNTNFLIESLVRMSPILLVSLGLGIAFKCKVWNIGAEGQLYIGAFVGAETAISLGNTPFTLPASIIMGILGGMGWAAIPALMKTRLGINEVITTFLMNFVAIGLVTWLISVPFHSPTAHWPQSASIPAAAVLPILIPSTRLHLGILISLIVVLPLIYFLMTKTTFGYKLKVVGENPEAAKYGGINVNRTIFLALIISGGLAGLAGLFEVEGIQFSVLSSLSPGYGYTGIAVALLGQNNPIGIALSSFFLAGIYNGSTNVSIQLGVPDGIVLLVQGTLIIFVLGSEHIMRFLERRIKR